MRNAELNPAFLIPHSAFRTPRWNEAAMNRMFLSIVAAMALPLAAFPQPIPSGNPGGNAPTPAANAPASSLLRVVRFDWNQLNLKRVDNHWQIWAGKQLIKDVGLVEKDAMEAWRLARDLLFTQYATIPGATPPFEFWLSDDASARGGLVVKNFISINNPMLSVEQISGAWVIRDDGQLLYNFGHQQEAALQALAVMKKYGFNQLGFVGMPKPVMTYLTVDPRQRVMTAKKPPDPREMIGKLSEGSLMLPQIGYVGSRAPIEARKLELAHQRDDWVMVYGKDVLARFGNNSNLARDGLRALQDARVDELCFIGTSRFPIFLNHGQAPRFIGLGFNNVRFQPGQLKAQAVNNIWCVVDGPIILFEFGEKQNDAELTVRVIQHFQFDQMCPIGDLTRGGFRYLTRSR